MYIYVHVFHNSRFSDYSHVLEVSVVDHKGHTIQLVIIAIKYIEMKEFHPHFPIKMRCNR